MVMAVSGTKLWLPLLWCVYEFCDYLRQLQLTSVPGEFFSGLAN